MSTNNDYTPTDNQVRSAATNQNARLDSDEYERWLASLKDNLREEIQAESAREANENTKKFLQRAARLVASWQNAERPFSDSHFDSDDALAELHAVGSLAVREVQELAEDLQANISSEVTSLPS